jgi:hypothetical protein
MCGKDGGDSGKEQHHRPDDQLHHQQPEISLREIFHCGKISHKLLNGKCL